MNRVEYVIGETYHRRVKSTQGRVIHDWEIFVDVTKGNVDLIRKVVFKIKCGGKLLTHTSVCATKSGSNWRFQLRRQTEGPVKVMVKLIGYKSQVVSRTVKIKLLRGKRFTHPLVFRTHGKPKSIRPTAIPECNFGIELELSTAKDISANDVVNILSSSTARGVVNLTHLSYYEAKKSSTDIWRLMPDSSMSCPRGGECSMFELVSPVLKGGSGLSEVNRVLKALNTITSVEVGKSMGFHVHIDVSHLSCHELVKVCQNFIKYEKAMDSFMPPSRREDVQLYCKSNEKAVTGPDAIASCATNMDLAKVMNPPGNDRYYKLNLQNLVTGRQPTLEFRHHSGTSNVSKVKNWVRFCMALVHNSAKYDPPFPVKKSIDDDVLFEMLMVHVINDRYLRDFYRMRRNELHKDRHFGEEEGNCCEGCAARGQCAAKFLPV